MVHAQRRRDPRITRTADLSATLRPAEEPARFGTLILNLSAGGMLIAGGGFGVGESIGIELAGPAFRVAGRAEVVRCTGQTTGLRIVSWQGSAHRPIGAMIAARLPVASGSLPSRASHRTTLSTRPPRRRRWSAATRSTRCRG